MTNQKIFKHVDKLLDEASKSNLSHKHACVAIRKGRQVSPYFHNYMRGYMFKQNCGSAHAEMATVNYLLNSMWRERWRVFYKLLNGESNIKMSTTDDKNLRKLRKKFSKIDLIVIKRSGSSENLGSSRPCCDCLKVLKILHLNVVYYSTSLGNIEYEKIRDMTSTHMSQSTLFMKENRVWS
jgi:hypothetical protein